MLSPLTCVPFRYREARTTTSVDWEIRNSSCVLLLIVSTLFVCVCVCVCVYFDWRNDQGTISQFLNSLSLYFCWLVILVCVLLSIRVFFCNSHENVTGSIRIGSERFNLHVPLLSPVNLFLKKIPNPTHNTEVIWGRSGMFKDTVYASGNHKIVSCHLHEWQDFCWYQKAVMSKKESYSCTEPSKIRPILPLKTMKIKKENHFFYRDNFVKRKRKPLLDKGRDLRGKQIIMETSTQWTTCRPNSTFLLFLILLGWGSPRATTGGKESLNFCTLTRQRPILFRRVSLGLGQYTQSTEHDFKVVTHQKRKDGDENTWKWLTTLFNGQNKSRKKNGTCFSCVPFSYPWLWYGCWIRIPTFIINTTLDMTTVVVLSCFQVRSPQRY